MTKEELRKVYIQKRSSLSNSQYNQLNKDLLTVFFKSIDLSQVKVLHCFLPIERNNEPDTQSIINEVRKRYPNISVVIPRVDSTTKTLENILYEPTTVLKKSGWGIPEPEDGVTVDAKSIDMVLVPMLIFDKQGHRVGYGKGFYDKLLDSANEKCTRVGICLFDPVERIDNIKDFDQPLDQCVTPSGSYRF
jgi:5-formyltetrahydrofolate cyclo-ligase